MNIVLKRSGIWLGLSFLMTIYWILGLMIAGALIPHSMPEASTNSESSSIMLFVICLVNTATVLFFIYNSHIHGWKLVLTIFLITFGLQYFLSQIETFWFNDALRMEHSLIWMVVLAGFISNLMFSITAAWITGSFKKTPKFQVQFNNKNPLIRLIAIHAIFTWPVIYFLAGYFIAWQFIDVRQYYTGSGAMESFAKLMTANFTSGLYFFQIFRGFIWISIAFLVLFALEGSTLKKSIILGLLFSIISSSQLLLPNPIMPDLVRIPHLIETSTSNFLWGFILAWTLDKFIDFKPIHS